MLRLGLRLGDRVAGVICTLLSALPLVDLDFSHINFVETETTELIQGRNHCWKLGGQDSGVWEGCSSLFMCRV